MSLDTVIIYHAECPDGFGAAWAAWKHFGDHATYLPVYHQTLPPDAVVGKHVYTIDYSYPREMVREYAPQALSWTIIDHHPSNEPSLPLSTKHLFDLNHSAAVLSWNFFHPAAPTPKLLQYIEDVDLWRFLLPDTKILQESWGLRDQDFAIWSTMVDDFESDQTRKKYLDEGMVLRKKIDQTRDRLIETAETVEFEGYTCLMVNAPVQVSEIGNQLAKKLPPIGIVWSRRKKKVIVSLRSDGTVDVAKLAERYGGGGLSAAAAFSWEVDNFLNFQEAKGRTSNES